MATIFNPNEAATEESGIFGLPHDVNEAKLVLLPVPWEATTSYGGGTSGGPRAMLQASKQIDLFDLELGNFFEAGIAMLPEYSPLKEWNHIAKKNAAEILNSYSEKVN